MTLSYKKSGVDIEAGDLLVERIKPFASATKRLGANSDLGGFGGLFDLAACKYKDPVLVSATDGVGTKLKIAFALNKHDTIGKDLVAMCVNDIVVQGAEPLFFLDYFATSGLDIDVAAKVIESIAAGCREAGCALIGGETAEMPGMYAPGHYDLAGFAVGCIERDDILPKSDMIKEGDTVLGLASSGVHSNGFSLIRYLVEEYNLSYREACEFGDKDKSLGEVLLEPTKIYVKSCLKIAKSVKALAHITGGGLLENIPRILPADKAVRLDAKKWQIPAVFEWIKNKGKIDSTEMLKTFNCGIGMVIIVSEENKISVMESLSKEGEKIFEIGSVINKNSQSVEVKNCEILDGK